MLSAKRYYELKQLIETDMITYDHIPNPQISVSVKEMEDLLDAYRHIWGEPVRETLESD